MLTWATCPHTIDRRQSDHRCSLSVSATLHFQCREVPKLSLSVNYLSFTVVLGAQKALS